MSRVYSLTLLTVSSTSSLSEKTFAFLFENKNPAIEPNKIAKEIITEMIETGAKASDIVNKKGLSVISDEGELVAIVEKIINDNPGQVAAYKSGKDKLFGFFVGQAMKATQGRANPQLINDIIKKKLSE